MESYYSFELLCKTNNRYYTVNLEGDAMTVTASDTGDTVKLPKSDRPAAFKMTRLPMMPVMLTINWERKLVFRLTADQAQAISTWSGPLTKADLAVILGERYRWLLPVAIVLIFLSFIIPDAEGDPMGNRISASLNLGLGVYLLVIYIISKASLSRVVFFLDFIWFIIAGITLCIDIYFNRSYLSLILIPLLFIGAWSGLYEFRRFKGVK